MTIYRDNGAIGALLDEYEKAVVALQTLLTKVSPTELITIVDAQTEDLDCRSIQTILSHVVRAGYCYVIEIRNSLGESQAYKTRQALEQIDEYQTALDDMFQTNVALFADYPAIKLETSIEGEKIKAAWGQSYDVEQLMEHAIVHVLRHRRQIERFLIKLRS